MSRLSFKTFCIEKYADYKLIPSSEVYKLFEEKRVLDMLDRDYEILHGFGFEYIVNDIDRFIRGENNETHNARDCQSRHFENGITVYYGRLPDGRKRGA